MPEHHQTWNQRAARSVVWLAAWTLAWMATLAVAKFGPGLLWDSQPVANWIAVVVNLVIGGGWIVAHARYLRGVDELQRKIMLDAIAIALGVGMVGGFAYAAAHSVGLIAFDANIAFLSAIMAVVYLVATVAGNIRYR
ncbi:MAG: hypothetical protein JWR71_1558 [Pseudarthrobacter sp.]|nr:hypothetical protein [Pseudarthrobacter sp.]